MRMANGVGRVGVGVVLLTAVGCENKAETARAKAVQDMKAFAAAVDEVKLSASAHQPTSQVLIHATEAQKLYQQLPPNPAPPGDAQYGKTAALYLGADIVDRAASSLSTLVQARDPHESAARWDRLERESVASLNDACRDFTLSYHEAAAAGRQ